ncbi:MAG: hypothetical protein VYE22_41795 [Myxococcota bacterium]|nr:hypothetical protein [Myxococcota bacterium]
MPEPSHTALLHKPVDYGSDAADLAFVLAVGVHAAIAGAAVVAGVIALLARKGGPAHRRVGAAFLWGMGAAAVTGIGVDLVRLLVRFEANHVAHAGLGMPSSIPARLAFLHAALCVLFFVRRGWAAFARRRAHPAERLVGPSLAGLGALAAIAIVLRFDPWTGALWMIATFSVAAALSSRLTRAPREVEHRFHLLFLAAFSWWGAAQGFGPALQIALSGVGPVAPYVGDRPGPFTPAFFGFLALWLPAFALAGWLGLRARRAAAR